jgi:2-phosphoglycolate phosphatase
MKTPIHSVLFDLDGTLLDTAPDLAATLNALLVEEQREPLPLASVRPWISLGAATMIKKGFGLTDDDPQLAVLRERFLRFYAAHIADHTVLFQGMATVLDTLETNKITWGIVTNKFTHFTLPLLEKMALASRSGCIVCGDTLPESKPHPAPLLHACQLLGTLPTHSVYVGDAIRDIEAGQRAGMQTLIALYGYLEPNDKVESWGATGMLQQPLDLLSWLSEFPQLEQ